VQALAVAAAAALSGIGTFGILKLVLAIVPMRAGVHEELRGLDLSEHGEEAYFGEELGVLARPGAGLGDSVIVAHAPEAAARPALDAAS